MNADPLKRAEKYCDVPILLIPCFVYMETNDPKSSH